MTNEEYSGITAAKFDIAEGRSGQHRNFSNSPAYRDAYDSTILAHKRAR